MKSKFLSPQTWPDGLKLTGLLLAGLLFSLGRFDWESNAFVAFRSWTFSAYFFCLILLGIYALARALAVSRWQFFWPLLTGLCVLLNLPYCWLGLDRFFYLSDHSLDYGREKYFTPEWLGRGHTPIPWNSTDAVLLALLALAALGCWIWGRIAQSAQYPANRRLSYFFLLLFACITVETWLHLSNRMPIVYITHYEQPESAHYVSAYYLLPEERGAVNSDFAYFVRLEEIFVGNSVDPPMLFVRRIFPFYLSSHLSYFIGVYRAFLILNPLFWLGATIAVFFFCRDLSGSAATAALAATFVALCPGFIMYAAYPASYVASYAMIAIAVWLYHRVVTSTRLDGFASVGAVGILLGLILLTYDAYAWPVFFIGYALMMRVALLRILASVGIGLAVYGGFFVLLFPIFKFVPDHVNDREIGMALTQVGELIRHPDSATIFPLISAAVGNYCQQMFQVHFFVTPALAVLGFFIGQVRRLRATALILLLPTFVSSMLLYCGEAPQHIWGAAMPRFNIPSYIAVALLAALAIDTAAQQFRSRGRLWLARCCVGVPLVACAILSNIDAFGLMPHLYFHIFSNSGGIFN